MEQQTFIYQQVLRYAVYFPAGDVQTVIGAIGEKYPSIHGSKVETGDSDVYFSYDSDRKPTYAMIFVEKLTKGTSGSESPDCLAVSFNESDLGAWRANYPLATAVVLDIYTILREKVPDVRARIGWLAHMCSWRTTELPRHSTRSAVIDDATCVVAPRRKSVSHAHKYSLTGKGGSVKQVKK